MVDATPSGLKTNGCDQNPG